MEKQKGYTRFAYLCVLPALILFTIFMVIPTINIFRISLYSWTGSRLAPMTFVGLSNFKKLFSDRNFLIAMQNSVLLIAVVAVFTLGLALIYAAILSREKVKGKSFFRIVFYVPNILSVVVISAVFYAVFRTPKGLLEGISPDHGWLGNQTAIVYVIAFIMIWQAIGYYMVMYISSMASVPASIYESADIDGAGRVRQFFGITLPLIWENLRTTMTFFVISSINISFLVIRALLGIDGGPGGSAQVALTFMYKQSSGMNSAYGYAMAAGVVIFIFSFALTALINALTKRETYQF